MKTIKISDSLCNYIESLQYEVDGISDMLTRVVGSDPAIIDYWYNKYVERYKEYRIAKVELENTLREDYGCTSMTGWRLNFNTQEVIVDEKEDL